MRSGVSAHGLSPPSGSADVPPLHASTEFHLFPSRTRTTRLAPGVGLLVGAGLSMALWATLIAGVRALIR
jgi:hypothetical protein